MKLQKEITELSKSKIQQWRAVMDELEVQLALGKAEAKDMFEKEKKTISTYIEKQKAQLSAEEKKEKKYQLELKTELEDLYRALDTDLSKSKRGYDRGKKTILRAIHLMESRLKENEAEYEKWLRDDFDDMKDHLDSYRIKLALGTFESVDELDDSQKELKMSIQVVLEKLKKLIYPEESKLNHFMDEISESLEHLKNAFSEILS